MKTLAIIAQKGGSGKTTIAVHLAVCAILHDKTVAVIDCDPQGSAYKWYKARRTEGLPGLYATKGKAMFLAPLLAKAEEAGIDLVIIDTAPHSDKEAAAAARVADFVLIPSRPARFDMETIESTMAIVRLTKAPASVVINVAPRGNLAGEAKDALRAQGFPVLDTVISSRVAFSHAVINGYSVHEYEPLGQAVKDINLLYDTLTQVLYL